MTDKKSNLTPFDSKVKEVSRNAKMIAQSIEASANTLTMLMQFSQDLEILSMELNLDPQERKAMGHIKGSVEKKMGQVLGHLMEAQKLSNEISDSLTESTGYGPYMGRPVTNPFKPIFSGKMASELIELGKQEPELRPHLRQILGHLKNME